MKVRLAASRIKILYSEERTGLGKMRGEEADGARGHQKVRDGRYGGRDRR